MFFFFQPEPAAVVKPNVEDKKTEEVLKAAFQEIAGADMEIDAYQLQEVLNKVFMKGTYVVVVNRNAPTLAAYKFESYAKCMPNMPNCPGYGLQSVKYV